MTPQEIGEPPGLTVEVIAEHHGQDTACRPEGREDIRTLVVFEEPTGALFVTGKPADQGRFIPQKAWRAVEASIEPGQGS